MNSKKTKGNEKLLKCIAVQSVLAFAILVFASLSFNKWIVFILALLYAGTTYYLYRMADGYLKKIKALTRKNKALKKAEKENPDAKKEDTAVKEESSLEKDEREEPQNEPDSNDNISESEEDEEEKDSSNTFIPCNIVVDGNDMKIEETTENYLYYYQKKSDDKIYIFPSQHISLESDVYKDYFEITGEGKNVEVNSPAKFTENEDGMSRIEKGKVTLS